MEEATRELGALPGGPRPDCGHQPDGPEPDRERASASLGSDGAGVGARPGPSREPLALSPCGGRSRGRQCSPGNRDRARPRIRPDPRRRGVAPDPVSDARGGFGLRSAHGGVVLPSAKARGATRQTRAARESHHPPGLRRRSCGRARPRGIPPRQPYDGKSEIYPSGFWQGAWRGIPPAPTWLTWFGPLYRDLVEESLRPIRNEVLPEGVLVSLGQEPLDLDQLQSAFPSLPGRLLSGVQEQVITLPTGRLVKVSPSAVRTAEFIPPLE